MKQSLAHVALVVRDYDEAIAFFTRTLSFELVEDTYQPEQDKRWVVVAPPGSSGSSLLLARASNPEQERFIGDQAGGRVFLFLSTDDFWRDYDAMMARGVRFVRPPSEQPYGTAPEGFSRQLDPDGVTVCRTPETEPYGPTGTTECGDAVGQGNCGTPGADNPACP